MPWILLFCIFGDIYASGIQDAEVNKVTAYFFCMDKRLLEDFAVKSNQWKSWMSFIACGCRFSRSFTVYSCLSKGWLLGIPNKAMISLSDHQTIAYCCSLSMPKATFIEPAVHMCNVSIRFWLFTRNKLNIKISWSWHFLGILKQKNNHFRLNWVNITS